MFLTCGKTWLYEHKEQYGLKILDSDSNQFSWIIKETEDLYYVVIDKRGMSPVVHKTKTRNPDFLANYIKHIKENMGERDYIFVSSHASVREALDAEGIDFTIVYPSSSCFAEWVGRCFIRDKRGESGCNPEVLYDNWPQWLRECEVIGCSHEEIVLGSGQHLSDFLMGRRIVL